MTNETPLLILGARGQVGRALGAEAGRRGLGVRAMGHAECDVSDPGAISRAIEGVRMVVNCAAYTAVDRAETDEETAFRINTKGAGNVAAACARVKIPLIHISTDYIFDGSRGVPIHELDRAHPLNVYGRTKLEGELAVRARRAPHIILRTSWVFSAHGENFVKTILRLAAGPSPLRIVNDQIGGPTAASDIAKAILDIHSICMKPGFNHWGTYHFSGAPPVSWFEFAKAIVAAQHKDIIPIGTKDFPRAGSPTLEFGPRLQPCIRGVRHHPTGLASGLADRIEGVERRSVMAGSPEYADIGAKLRIVGWVEPLRNPSTQRTWNGDVPGSETNLKVTP